MKPFRSQLLFLGFAATGLLLLGGCNGGTDIQAIPSTVTGGGDDSGDDGGDVRGRRTRSGNGESRVSDIDFERADIEQDFSSPADESDCQYFTSSGSLPLTQRPPGFSDSATVIDHFPPAQYPMPVHETFEDGEWKGDDTYEFIALVDVLIDYNVHQVPYDSRFKTALPGTEEDPAYERRYYTVTISNAQSSGCTISYVKN